MAYNISHLLRPLEAAVNTFTKIEALKCAQPDPWIYAESALLAAAQLYFTIEEPDPRELITKTTGHSLLHHLKTRINKALPGEGFQQGQFRHGFWKLAGLADVGTFWFFLAGAFTNTANLFTSQVYKLTRADCVTNPNEGYGTFFFGAIHDDGEWGTLDFRYQPPSRFAPVSPSQIQLLPGKRGTIAGGAQFVTFGSGEGVPVSSRIYCLEDNTVYATNTDNVDTGTDTAGSNLFANIEPASYFRTLQLQWRCEKGNLPEHEAFPLPETCWCYMQAPPV